MWVARQRPLATGAPSGGAEVDMVIERAGALTAAEPGRVKQKMIVCRTKIPFRLLDGT
ncbi:MAG TPA: hypothetical protein VN666_20060 [Nitrospira sp.]|nr:hypothetical protein [Nitrospira sp.]